MTILPIILIAIMTVAWVPLLVKQFRRWWLRKRPESAAFGLALLVLALVGSAPLWAEALDVRDRGLIWYSLAGSSFVCCLLLYLAHYLGSKIDSGES